MIMQMILLITEYFFVVLSKKFRFKILRNANFNLDLILCSFGPNQPWKRYILFYLITEAFESIDKYKISIDK